MRTEFDRALDNLGIRDRVEWLSTEDVAPYYRRTKIFLLCSINGGLSLACLEAMACGAVPVTTDCGEMGDVARSGETGELVPAGGTETQFAAKVTLLLHVDRRRRRYAATACALVHR